MAYKIALNCLTGVHDIENIFCERIGAENRPNTGPAPINSFDYLTGVEMKNCGPAP